MRTLKAVQDRIDCSSATLPMITSVFYIPYNTFITKGNHSIQGKSKV